MKKQDTTTNKSEAPETKKQASWRSKTYGTGIVAAIAAVTLLLGGAGGFALGSSLDGDQRSSRRGLTEFDGGRYGGPPSDDMMRAMGIYGEVTSVSDDSITVTGMRSGEAATYAITDNTTIRDGNDEAAVSDISEGDTVRIRTVSDDENTASSIDINPTMRGPGAETQRDSTTDTESTTNET